MLARCDELREETGGFFDARAESHDGGRPVRARQGLVGRPRRQACYERHGIENYSINAGGDLAARRLRAAGGRLAAKRSSIRYEQRPYGGNRGGAPISRWRRPGPTCAASTSLDPQIAGSATGGPALGDDRGRELGTADAYATAAFAMGESGPG